ncbi:MAG: ATP-binding protein, partial [Thermoleophilia bacterium]
ENDQRYHVQARIINESGREWFMEAFGKLEKDENGDPARLSGTAQDITEQKQLQEQLIQAQKIESVGRLAGGIAHDFNNSLQVILGEVELVKLEIPGNSSLRESLATIQRAAEHSANITQQLLSFARQQIIDPKALDLNKSVSDSIDLLQRLIGEDINLRWQPRARASLVMMDPVKIQQVLTNLCVNAREAISGVGNIGIVTDNVSLGADDCQNHTDFYPGDFITLEVTDDGCGMQPETLKHLFEPFFTTRGYGAGTGLGLATVYGIIKQIDGFIDVTSSAEQGSSFRIYLPLVEAAEADPGQQADSRTMASGRGETVLLVEDDTAVLELGVKILGKLGYKVIQAATPEAAIRAAEEHIDEIDFLITDVIMPGMNGRELAAGLLKLKPELKCLFMSGYTDDIITQSGILEDEIDFIQKPFSMKEIAIKLRGMDGVEAREPTG